MSDVTDLGRLILDAQRRWWSEYRDVVRLSDGDPSESDFVAQTVIAAGWQPPTEPHDALADIFAEIDAHDGGPTLEQAVDAVRAHRDGLAPTVAAALRLVVDQAGDCAYPLSRCAAHGWAYPCPWTVLADELDRIEQEKTT